MAQDRYDAIVVGARCAGSPTAMLLARRGHRVLVVDRATFPSDTVSTHLVHQPGIAALADFERLPAARQADEAGALLRTLGAPVRTGPKGVGALTKRETEVLRLVAEGMSNPEIARRLVVTEETVKTHVSRILARFVGGDHGRGNAG